jgi:hypothetical protein
MQVGSRSDSLHPAMEPKVQADAADQPLPCDKPRSDRHPLFGALRDVTFVLPEVDLTEPADPEWATIREQVSLYPPE